MNEFLRLIVMYSVDAGLNSLICRFFFLDTDMYCSKIVNTNKNSSVLNHTNIIKAELLPDI